MATTHHHTLALHDALPILERTTRSIRDTSVSNWLPREFSASAGRITAVEPRCADYYSPDPGLTETRSEEHTSELQSQSNLVCRLLLEKKKQDGFHAQLAVF